ncbi:MAG: SDR family NAD(P)-dependent oxidoreductase, partial [Planctomycetota bacterium]
MTDPLKNKRILVTGASRGIGRAIAVDLARHGARVGVLATRLANLEETCAEIAAAGGTSLPMEGDISDPATAQNAVAKMIEAWDGIDGLVANAGVTADNLLLRMSEDQFDKVVDVNLKGNFH